MLQYMYMEPEIKQLIEAQQKKIDEMYATMEKIRKYMQWTLIATVVFFVLPLLAAVFIVPFAISSYTATLGGLGL
ncbi:MAG: hypothetical protein RLY49_48 [Candidatus Parcubacteria bacterium]